MTRSANGSSRPGPAPSARSRSRPPRRSRSRDSCCAIRGPASSLMSLPSGRRGRPVQYDATRPRGPMVTTHLHDLARPSVIRNRHAKIIPLHQACRYRAPSRYKRQSSSISVTSVRDRGSFRPDQRHMGEQRMPLELLDDRDHAVVQAHPQVVPLGNVVGQHDPGCPEPIRDSTVSSTLCSRDWASSTITNVS